MLSWKGRPLSHYFTHYQSDMSVAWQQQSGPVSSETFTQTLHRLEQQFAWAMEDRLKFTGGLGGSVEIMNTSSYKTGNNMAAGFACLQTKYNPTPTTELTGGLRNDRHNTYGGKLNPSIGLQQKIYSQFTFRVSAGTGFKAPDYKTRYQVFVNPLSNYMVVGTEVLAATLQQLEKAGEISEIRQHLLRQQAGINLSCRVNYRGKYPFGDANNNYFIDRYDAFVDGYFLLYATRENPFYKDHLSAHATVDNLLDYTDRLMPAHPGRILLVGVQYRFLKD